MQCQTLRIMLILTQSKDIQSGHFNDSYSAYVFDSLGENCAQLDAKNSLSLYVIMAFFLQTSLPLMGHNSFCIYPKD